MSFPARLVIFLCLVNLIGLVYLIWRHETGKPPLIETPREPVVTHTYDCELVRVIDGNTVVVNVDLGFGTWLRDHKFELLDVEPPISQQRRKDSGAYLESLLKEKKLTLQSIQNRKAGFGRWLGVLFADGAEINAKMTEYATLDE